MNNMKQQNSKPPIYFTSEDSEGSNKSYISSEELDKNEPSKGDNNIQLLKDKMYHFFLENPEVKDSIRFSQLNPQELLALENEERLRQQQM